MGEFTVSEYNGWKNYETWNVALWIGNDELLYQEARRYKRKGYMAFREALRQEIGMTETPDHVSLNDSGLDVEALDRMIKEL